MKKSTVQSIGIGSVILTTIAVGAWFMLFSEPAKKKNIILPSSPSQTVTEKDPQQDIPSSAINQEKPSASHKQPLEKVPAEVTSEEPSQNISLEDTKKTEINEPTDPDNSDKNIPEETMQAGQPEVSPSAHPSQPPLAEEQALENKLKEKKAADTAEGYQPEDKQDNILSGQQHEEKNISGPSCTEVSPTLSNFFNKLEKKQYNQETESSQPLQEHFNGLATQLLNNPPVVTHETDELYTLLTNTAHFFRILGKDNMRLLQKVLKQENTDFENIAAEMYQLSITGEECVSGAKKLEVPFTAAYEYAGFFLNTLGGRSYLFRRDPGTRLLVNYYAVLILDQANKKQRNIYGVDIREQLPWLIQEMEANNRLTNKERYLDKLYELAENYQALP